MTRRDFGLGVGGAAAGLAAQTPRRPRFIKSICGVIFPREMPLAEQFRAAKNAGFDAVEIRFGDEVSAKSTPDELKRVADAAADAKIQIASLWASEGLALRDAALNDPDPAKREKGVAILRQAIETAAAIRCGAVLLVPGRLGAGTKFRIGYQDTWDRVTAEIKKVLPDALRENVLVTPENVWNKFLVSPLEMKTFIDQFESPYLQAHFDCGNCMEFGFPEDWIQTLGPRIKRVHLKDYKNRQFVDLLEGDVDWKAVMQALVKAGYRGTLSPEYGGGKDPGRLAAISRALDKILALA